MAAVQRSSRTCPGAATPTSRRRAARKYSYDYVTEADLMKGVRPLLAKHGIAFYYRDEILELRPKGTATRARDDHARRRRVRAHVQRRRVGTDTATRPRTRRRRRRPLPGCGRRSCSRTTRIPSRRTSTPPTRSRRAARTLDARPDVAEPQVDAAEDRRAHRPPGARAGRDRRGGAGRDARARAPRAGEGRVRADRAVPERRRRRRARRDRPAARAVHVANERARKESDSDAYTPADLTGPAAS
jgi:hypothetical protein